MSFADKFRLDGKKALVTGGATGLGYHMTRALAEAGATVLIAARRENVLREAAERLNAELRTSGVLYHAVDLLDRKSVATLATHAMEKIGGVDIFIGNAAYDVHEHMESITDTSIDQILQANVSANVELTRSFLPRMRKQRWGRFIFSSSANALVASPHEGSGMYTAVKGALNSFVRTLAAETGHDNITANSLGLGFFMTDMVRHAQQTIRAAEGEAAATRMFSDFINMSAVGRAGEPRELEGLIQLLASDAGSFITGANIAIDGGLSIMMRPHIAPAGR